MPSTNRWGSLLISLKRTVHILSLIEDISKKHIPWRTTTTTTTWATHRRPFPLHITSQWFPKIKRCCGGWELWILKQFLVPDAVFLEFSVVLVFVRDGRGEHCPGADVSRLRTDDKTFSDLVFIRTLCGKDLLTLSNFWTASWKFILYVSAVLHSQNNSRLPCDPESLWIDSILSGRCLLDTALHNAKTRLWTISGHSVSFSTWAKSPQKENYITKGDKRSKHLSSP